MPSTGKWLDPAVPKQGWRCIDITDLETVAAICDMCEVREIRFVHTMHHPRYGTLESGCICAGHMEGDLSAAKTRERRAKNEAVRKKNWLGRKGWRRSAKGNDYITTDGHRVVVFQRRNGRWSGSITNVQTDETRWFRKQYKTQEAAKLAGFSALMFLLRAE